MFGLRRPLRHLTWKLGLSDEQVRELVAILDRLKTAYGQARLDRERSMSEVAAVFSAAEFDQSRVGTALQARTRSSETLNAELLVAIRDIFALLDDEQRREFSYLLRSGTFVL